MRDLYQALGLERTATADQIKKAYRKLTAKYHPDKHSDSNNAAAEERFKEISAAYEVLSDPERRLWYDEFGAASLERGFDPDIAREQTRQRTWRGTPVTPTSTPFEDILQSIVGMMGQVQALPVPFLEALRGGKVKLPSGIVLGDVPPGTQTGDLLTFVNPKNHDGPPISLRVTVLPHPLLTRSGNNLVMLLPVTLAEVYRGGPIEVHGPWATVQVRLPQGIHHGERLRLAGHGVRIPGRAPGDLLAEIVLIYPEAGDEALGTALARLQGNGTPRAPV